VAVIPAPIPLFRQRAFVRYWLSGTLSNIGTWLQNVVAAVTVFQLTGSPLYVGFLGFASFLPLLVLSLPAGVLSDRVDRRRIVVVTHLVAAAAALVASAALWADLASWPLIAMVAFTTHAAYALAKPALVAMLPSLVPRAQLTEATAAATMQFSIGQFVGPLLGSAFLLADLPAAAFAVNAATFLIPVWAMSSLPRSPSGIVPGTNVGRAMRDGIATAWSDRAIRGTLAAVLVVGVVPEVIRTLSPLVAVQVFDRPEAFAGVVIAALSVGSVVGLLAFRVFPAFRDITRTELPIVGFLGQGLGLVVLVVAPNLAVGLIGLAMIGLGHALAFTSLTAFLQGITSDQFRGRVLSIHTLAHLGSRPVTALLSGILAATFGAVGAVMVFLVLIPCGVAATAGARRSVRVPVESIDAATAGETLPL
jgi:MFS family permease